MRNLRLLLLFGQFVVNCPFPVCYERSHFVSRPSANVPTQKLGHTSQKMSRPLPSKILIYSLPIIMSFQIDSVSYIRDSDEMERRPWSCRGVFEDNKCAFAWTEWEHLRI